MLSVTLRECVPSPSNFGGGSRAGSFQNAPDADNLKARLALVGIEATIQTTNLPEKGVWHRVRVGPYSDVEELNRIRGVLKQNGVDAALVKVREAEK